MPGSDLSLRAVAVVGIDQVFSRVADTTIDPGLVRHLSAHLNDMGTRQKQRCIKHAISGGGSRPNTMAAVRSR